MIDLTGRVALVPGANGNIGHEVARTLAACGCDVALTCHSKDDKAKEALDFARGLGRRARLDRLDAADLDAATAWVEDAIAEFGRADILANCVGWHSEQGFALLTERSPEIWRAVIDVQLMSFINLSYAVVRPMMERKAGRIMSVGSDGGKVGQSGAAVASAAHGGVIAFAKALAREAGRFGVTANVVCPGPTEGPTLEDLRRRDTVGARIVEEMIRRIPLKRAGSNQEIAATMAFLASEHGGYITGQAISVSGGLTMN